MEIEIKNYTKELNNNVILKNVNLKLTGGKIYGLVGKNGSGKSILLKSICGLANIKDGQIKINNQVLGKDIEFSPDIGALLDGAGFIPYVSGFKNLKLLASINNRITDNDIRESMKSLDLNPDDNKPYRKYSLGMKQKLALAQALMEKPQILILDEPFNAIDSESVIEIRNMLLEYKRKGALILITSHVEEDIKLMCDEVFKIKAGEVYPYDLGSNKEDK